MYAGIDALYKYMKALMILDAHEGSGVRYIDI